MPKNYWMTFISSIPLNWDHYNPKMTSFHFLNSISLYLLCKKIYIYFFWITIMMNPIYIFGVQFLLHWLDYLYSAPQFLLQSNTWIQSSFCCKVHTYWYLYEVLSYKCPILVFWFINYSHLYPFYTHRKWNKIQEKTLQNSSTNRICNQRKTTTPFFHTLHFIFFFTLWSGYLFLPLFFFSLYTSVSFSSDAGHENCLFVVI